MSSQSVEITQKMNSLIDDKSPFVLITLVNARGSTPQDQGAKAIVTEKGLLMGTVGGGKVEAKAIVHAQELLKGPSQKRTELKTWNLQKDVKMTCGGEVQFFFEVFFYNEWHVAVFGAGHVAQALIRVLSNLECKVTCVDARPEWLEKLPCSTNLEIICAPEPKTFVQNFPMDTFFVLMSQGHATDLPVLLEILSNRRAPYVGVIGSKQKKMVLQKELLELGLDEKLTEEFLCPMGLPIGNNSPAEIALSIAAQLLECRDRPNDLR